MSSLAKYSGAAANTGRQLGRYTPCAFALFAAVIIALRGCAGNIMMSEDAISHLNSGYIKVRVLHKP